MIMIDSTKEKKLHFNHLNNLIDNDETVRN